MVDPTKKKLSSGVCLAFFFEFLSLVPVSSFLLAVNGLKIIVLQAVRVLPNLLQMNIAFHRFSFIGSFNTYMHISCLLSVINVVATLDQMNKSKRPFQFHPNTRPFIVKQNIKAMAL